MARKRITQATIAEALGKTQQSVSLRVNGRVPITVDDLHTIALVLDVPVADLLGAPARAEAAS
ncbi:DNA-binding protein [Actinotalea ferrariae CF5-4]|uniref:DNA-binding protein n=2 Tax=Actinotalea TaxID=458839 RepID=A0A021VX91_9CELL|nr:DNA-binding protein [Actinotalea ferrariae CF5-4]